MQVMSGSNLQPVPWQSAARQAQDSPQAAQAVVDRFSDTPQLQALAQAEPQPPATNAWMERLLQELSLDDEDGGNASVEVGIAA